MSGLKDKFNGLFGKSKGENTPNTVDQKAERRKHLHQCISAATFQDLDELGRKEFKEKAMSESDARRLDFYLNAPNYEDNFLRECLQGGRHVMKDVEDDLDVDDILSKAKEVSDCVSSLKNKMKPDLDSLFDTFKNEYCRDELKKLQ